MNNNDKETEDKPQSPQEDQDQEQNNSEITTNDFTQKEDISSSPTCTNLKPNNDNNVSQTSSNLNTDKKTEESAQNGSKSTLQTSSGSNQTQSEDHQSSNHERSHHRKARSSSNHRSRRKKHRSRRKYNSRSPSRSYSRSRSHSRSRSRGSVSSKSRSRSHSRSASYSPRPRSNTDRTRSRDQLSLHNPSAHQTPRSATRSHRSKGNRRPHKNSNTNSNSNSNSNSNDSPQESTYANALKGSTGRTFNIFVKNLPRTCAKQDLRNLFSRFGEIYSCAVIKRKKNPTTKCFGFVNFATEQAQMKAVRASGKIHMNDSMIECEVSSNVTVVYMGNLPLDVTKSDIRYHVRTYGGCYKSIHIRHGHCFIVYDSYYAAEKAIQQLQNTSINGSAVWVAVASETKAKMLSTCPELPAQRSLFIGNLAMSVKEDELRDVFIKYGRITSVRIPRIHGNNKPRGFAFVEFENSGDAELALRAERGKALHGQKLDIDWCRDSGKAAGPNGHGDLGNNRGSSHGNLGNMGTVQVMPHLDTKTLDSLPVMEVEPGKFVKVIPASFMQGTQFTPRGRPQTPRRNMMNNYVSPQGKFHHGNMSRFGGNQNTRHVQNPRYTVEFEGTVNRGRDRRDRRAPIRREQVSVSRSRSRSRSASHKRTRHRSGRHRSRHKSSKHSDHHKTSRHRSSRKKKDGDKKSSRRKHRQSKSEEKGERRSSSRSRSRSRSRSNSFRDKSESRERSGRSRTRSRSRSRSMTSDRSHRSRSRSYNEKIVSKQRSNSCDDTQITKARKTTDGDVKGKESEDKVNGGDVKMKEEDGDVNKENDNDNDKDKEDTEDKITTTTTILNDVKDDAETKKVSTDD